MSGAAAGGGALGGAAAGAAIGSVVPGVGTLFGALIGAGAGSSIAGQLISADSEAKLDQQKKEIAAQQADELESREQVNAAIRLQQSYRVALDVSSEQATSGHAGGGIGSQLEIKRQADLQNMLSQRDADFQALMLRKGGDLYGQLGDQTKTAGYFNAAGTLLTAAGTMANPKFGAISQGSPQRLPSPPSDFSGTPYYK